MRAPQGWVRLTGVSRHNLRDVSVDIPLCVLTAVTGVSGSGKSTLVSQVLAEDPTALESFDRLVLVDQRPIGRTPRSNLATYTGMFDTVRKLYAATDEAQARGYGAGRFSFNVPEGRCETCQGEGFVAVELLFLPGTYAPCPTCHGARYNAETLEITYRDKNVAEVLGLSVDDAAKFLADVPAAARSLETLRDVGLGYLRLGQPATELSGGEAQRIKLATELQRARRGHALYLLDEPTSGLHPADIALLLRQLHRLVDAGNTVVLVEHDLDAIATADWVIDLGPGGGDAGGRVVATGTPADVAQGRGERDRAVPRAAARADLSWRRFVAGPDGRRRTGHGLGVRRRDPGSRLLEARGGAARLRSPGHDASRRCGCGPRPFGQNLDFYEEHPGMLRRRADFARAGIPKLFRQFGRRSPGAGPSTDYGGLWARSSTSGWPSRCLPLRRFRDGRCATSSTSGGPAQPHHRETAARPPAATR